MNTSTCAGTMLVLPCGGCRLLRQSFLANCLLGVYNTSLSECFALIPSRNYSASKMDFVLCKSEVCLLTGCLTSL